MSERVTMKALDTMHMSNVRADNLQAGDVFTVSEAEAKHLEDRGLAERGGKSADAVNVDVVASDRVETREGLDKERGFAEGKAISAAPQNKMQAASDNKTVEVTDKRKGK